MGARLKERLAWRLGRLMGLTPYLALRDDYLRPVGWLRSREESQSIDADGRPLPWIAYAAIAFLADRVRPDMLVFEYGSGNSTRWWATHVARVVACEHDKGWFDRVYQSMPTNVMLQYHELVPDGAYARSSVVEGEAFHVIVIDGRDRVNCARHAVGALREDGVIIWDNTERDEYSTGIRELLERGFRRIDFVGLGPINAHPSRTTVFYRSSNCLGI